MSIRTPQRALSHAQLRALHEVSQGYVDVTWADNTPPPGIARSTLLALRHRGLVRFPFGNIGRARLTPFGRQVARALWGMPRAS